MKSLAIYYRRVDSYGDVPMKAKHLEKRILPETWFEAVKFSALPARGHWALCSTVRGIA